MSDANDKCIRRQTDPKLRICDFFKKSQIWGKELGKRGEPISQHDKLLIKIPGFSKNPGIWRLRLT
jgi:hypothetical protein